MLNRFTADAQHIYLAIGATDFRKQISSLVSMVQLQFGMDLFMETSIFLFCNKKKDSIKVLKYDKNGFILAHKKLLDKMKFQWSKDSSMIKEIPIKQEQWLLEGLELEKPWKIWDTFLKKCKGKIPMTEQEELLKLHALLEEKELLIHRQTLTIETQEKLIEKQRIQIDNMIQALLHARKKLFGPSSKRVRNYF